MIQQQKKYSLNDQGMILVSIMGIVIFLSIIIVGIFGLAGSNLTRARQRISLLSAQYAAESGADAAIAILNGGNAAYSGSSSDVTVINAGSYKATFSSTVTPGATASSRLITAVGKIYIPITATTPKYIRTIRVTAQQSSTTSASSIVSRNILALDSGVKNVFAKDLYVNGFISMAKNTTNIVAENITVAGKNTGASNCSIDGSGNLLKPSSFTTSGQTRTNVTLGYNNCITPPGNSSNSNFNVSVNQGNISTVQSIYIPWAAFMDASYQNSPSGCADWSGGASPHNIPAIAGSKQTHYPDSSSTISATCGTKGDLNLGSGQFNITDNVHLRANLCAASACTPTFYNPSTTLRYVFVEGSVNFNSIQAPSNSGPIAFIIYGADPSSKAGICPYGGAAYLGNAGTTSAADIYLLALNGVCLDKTKFSTNPALGGIAGKNIYIATNPGSPFDLALDPNFPVSQIPTNLTWRAVQYQRL